MCFAVDSRCTPKKYCFFHGSRSHILQHKIVYGLLAGCLCGAVHRCRFTRTVFVDFELIARFRVQLLLLTILLFFSYKTYNIWVLCAKQSAMKRHRCVYVLAAYDCV